MSKEYAIVVRQRVPTRKLNKPDDRIINPRGAYTYRASSADHALDLFHREVPIGCLDDFEITCTQVTPG